MTATAVSAAVGSFIVGLCGDDLRGGNPQTTRGNEGQSTKLSGPLAGGRWLVMKKGNHSFFVKKTTIY